MKNILISLSIVLITSLLSCSAQTKTVSTSKNSNINSIEVPSHEHNNYFESYNLEDQIFGTKTKVTLTEKERIMVTNSLPNHFTGEFPTTGNPNTISAQNKTYTFPANPKYTGNPTWVRETGIALNGIKFEPGTAEVVFCDTGESYRVEAFQDLINLGLDFNHAHVQPTGAYHYHGTPTSLIEDFDTGEDLVHIGFAKDGFPIYFSKTEAYTPSYRLLDGTREGEDCTYSNPMNIINVAIEDNHDGTYTSDFEFVQGSGDLDECNGITVDGKYMYLVTESFPYVSRCLMGEFVQEERQGPRPDQQQDGAKPGGQRQRPNSATIMEQIDSNKDGKLSKEEAKGPLQEQFSAIDTNEDGYLTQEELEKNRKENRQNRTNDKSQRNRN